MAVVRRIVARTGARVWQHKPQWLAAGAVSVGLVFAQHAAVGSPVGPGANDCADRVMYLYVQPSRAVAQAAYPCLGEPYTRVLSEEAFVAQARARTSNADGAPAEVSRLGEQQLADGRRVVHFKLHRADKTLSYQVRLATNGLVESIE